MNATNAIQLNRGMGEEVIERLQRYVDMPADGILAGQSVASALSELYGDGKGVVYNDVDVFRKYKPSDSRPQGEDWDFPSVSRSKRAIDTCSFLSMEISQDYHELSVTMEKSYRVLRTTRKDMLNEVICSFEGGSLERFLRTFDMNAVQVGVKLETRELFWTSDYERFLRSRELSIVQLHTPFHSLIRYFRKRQELEGITGNDERMLELIAMAYQVGVKSHSSKEGIPKELEDLRWGFGKQVAEKLQSVGSNIFPHFNLETTEVKGYPVSRLIPKHDVGQDLMSLANEPSIAILPLISEALREIRDPVATERLKYLATSDTSNSVARVCWFGRGMSFAEGNATAADLAEMDSTVDRTNISLQFEMETADEQLSHFQDIEKEVARRGDWVCSALAKHDSLKVTGQKFVDHIAELEHVLKATTWKPVLPKLKLNGYVAEELTRAFDVFEEVGTFVTKNGVLAYARSEDTSVVKVAHPDGDFALRVSCFSPCQPRYEQAFYSGNNALTEAQSQFAQQYAELTDLGRVFGGFFAVSLATCVPSLALRLAKMLWTQRVNWSNHKRNLAIKGIRIGYRLSVIPNAVSFSPYDQPVKFWGITLPLRALATLKRKVMLAQRFSPKARAAAKAIDDDSLDIPF